MRNILSWRKVTISQDRLWTNVSKTHKKDVPDREGISSGSFLAVMDPSTPFYQRKLANVSAQVVATVGNEGAENAFFPDGFHDENSDLPRQASDKHMRNLETTAFLHRTVPG